jgi:RES domain-containing protein
MVYCSEHPALAAFEKLVHIEDPDELRESYVLIPVECEDALVKPLPKPLPRNWDSNSALHKLRALGDAWVGADDSVAVFVPSVVLPRSNNILLNPAQADFAKLKIGRPVPFNFDPRLDRK